MVGAEGVGLFQIAYSYYGLMLIIITGGMPTAVALNTAKDSSLGWWLFKSFSIVIIVVGGLVSLLTFWFSDGIAQLLGNSQLDFAIRCVAPALFAVPLLSLLRGYLQGQERYSAIALSEVTEQAVRIASMLIFVSFFLSDGLTVAVGGGILGSFTGAFFSFFLLVFLFAFTQKPIQRIDNSQRLRPALSLVFQTSIIIALTRLLIPASDLFDAILIQKRLQVAGHTASEAMAMYGVLTGMAVIVVYMPTLLTAALSHTLTMKIAADWQEGRINQFNRRIYAALELGWVWGWASGLFIFEYSGEFSWLLFGTDEATKPIQYLAFIPLIVGFRELTTSILWTQDRKKVPFVGLLTGIFVTFFLLYFLVSIPGFGYAGAAISLLSMELVAAVWNMAAIKPVRAEYFRPMLLALDVLILTGLMFSISLSSDFFLSLTSSKPIALALGIILYLGGAGIYLVLRLISKIKQYS